jgi:PAS domain S-box-containing protein
MPEKTGANSDPKDGPGPQAAGAHRAMAPPASLEIGSVLHRMTDAFLALDAAGRVTYGNPAAERTLGCRLEEVLGQEVGNCLAESARSLFEQTLTRAMTLRPEKPETWLVFPRKSHRERRTSLYLFSIGAVGRLAFERLTLFIRCFPVPTIFTADLRDPPCVPRDHGGVALFFPCA